jgi:hypothetical protein
MKPTNMPRYTTDREIALARRAMGEPNIAIPPPKKKHGNEESLAQQALIKWWAVACKAYGIPERLLFSIPNGGWRDPLAMVFLKREGLRPGTADLMLCLPGHNSAGLFIELKTATGKVSAEQEQFIADVRKFGYRAEVCRSAAEARNVICAYIELRNQVLVNPLCPSLPSPP